MHPLGKVCGAGCHHKFAHAGAVQVHRVHAAGGAVQSGTQNLLLQCKCFAEQIDRVTHLAGGIVLIVAHNPHCPPVIGGCQTDLSISCLAPLSLLPIFIRQTNLPAHTVTAFVGHGQLRVHEVCILRRVFLPRFLVYRGPQLIGRLPHCALHVPENARNKNVNAHGGGQIFGFQIIGLYHRAAPLCKVHSKVCKIGFRFFLRRINHHFDGLR